MGDKNLHARKVLLRQYEAACMALERPISYKQCYFFAGKLRVLAEVLQECRHTGDSVALKPEEWIKDADQRIVNALRVLEQQGELLGETPKEAPKQAQAPADPFTGLRQSSQQAWDFMTKDRLL